MQLTIEQLLIGFLSTSKAPKGTQAIAFLLLDKEDQQLEMCCYLSENPDATEQEIMEMAYKIARAQY